MIKTSIIQRIKESIAVKEHILNTPELLESIENLSVAMERCIRNGGKILLCGNGGSASDALHIAGEIVGRFQKERTAWPAIALNADVATMTAIANDYGFDAVYARQVEGLMTEEDLLIGLSTSGNSENIYQAIQKANEKGGKTAAFLGRDGGKIKAITNYPIVIPGQVTARTQESHIMIAHILCELLEDALTRN